jgi:hypothetical protein
MQLQLQELVERLVQQHHFATNEHNAVFMQHLLHQLHQLS